jgi:vanillate O-demethylase monooxygenase subunit
MSYLRNIWYMAGWEEDIAGEALLERRLLGRDWLLYRRQDGAYAMLHNRCPHRFATLSQGKRKGDSIACPYHGLEFSAQGACLHNPFSSVSRPMRGLMLRLWWPAIARSGSGRVIRARPTRR